MKNPIEEIKKYKDFPRLEEEARLKVAFAVIVYQRRNKLGWTQKELAKKCYTTQRIISNIENGEMNQGLWLFSRLIKNLGLSGQDLDKIFY